MADQPNPNPPVIFALQIEADGFVTKAPQATEANEKKETQR